MPYDNRHFLPVPERKERESWVIHRQEEQRDRKFPLGKSPQGKGGASIIQKETVW